jgi:hypothetical protein
MMPKKANEDMADHTWLQVPPSREQPASSKRWLNLKGTLPKEAISAWRSALEASSAPDEPESRQATRPNTPS